MSEYILFILLSFCRTIAFVRSYLRWSMYNFRFPFSLLFPVQWFDLNGNKSSSMSSKEPRYDGVHNIYCVIVVAFFPHFDFTAPAAAYIHIRKRKSFYQVDMRMWMRVRVNGRFRMELFQRIWITHLNWRWKKQKSYTQNVSMRNEPSTCTESLLQQRERDSSVQNSLWRSIFYPRAICHWHWHFNTSTRLSVC